MEEEISSQNFLSFQHLGFFAEFSPIHLGNSQNHNSIQSLFDFEENSNSYSLITKYQCLSFEKSNDGKKGKKYREDWSEEEEKKCYKFLGVFMSQNPFQFRSWGQRNSHIYPQMSKKIGSRTIRQCKSKLSTLKKKYSKNSANGIVISSLKQLVLLKLKEYSKTDGECEQIYNAILEQHKKLDNELKRQIRTALEDYQQIDSISKAFPIFQELGEKKAQKNNQLKTKNRKLSRKTSQGSSRGDDLDYFNLEQIKELKITELKTSASLTVSKDHEQML